MSIFGTIVSAIFKHAPAAAPASGSTTASATPTAEPATAAPASSATTAASAPSQIATPAAPVDVEAILTKLASQHRERLDWRHSIVDLMKLLNIDSSLSARKELATELHYTGDENNSAAMNIWLHKEVMTQLAANGGNVPDDLKH